MNKDFLCPFIFGLTFYKKMKNRVFVITQSVWINEPQDMQDPNLIFRKWEFLLPHHLLDSALTSLSYRHKLLIFFPLLKIFDNADSYGRQFRYYKLNLEQINLFQTTEQRKHFQATVKSCIILLNKQINMFKKI